jgi:hypothetical protein
MAFKVYGSLHPFIPKGQQENSGNKMNERTGRSSRKYDFNLCLPHTNT